jgi:hypothetical protein
MTHSNAAPRRPIAAGGSAAQHRFRLGALALAAGGVLLALSIWVATPLSASARSSERASYRRAVVRAPR